MCTLAWDAIAGLNAGAARCALDFMLLVLAFRLTAFWKVALPLPLALPPFWKVASALPLPLATLNCVAPLVANLSGPRAETPSGVGLAELILRMACLFCSSLSSYFSFAAFMARRAFMARAMRRSRSC